MQALCCARNIDCRCHNKTTFYKLHVWNVQKDIYARKAMKSRMRDKELTNEDFRLKCSSVTRISTLVYPALMVWENLKTPWIHNFYHLPPKMMKTTKRVCSTIQRENIFHLKKMSLLALSITHSESNCISYQMWWQWYSSDNNSKSYNISNFEKRHR